MKKLKYVLCHALAWDEFVLWRISLGMTLVIIGMLLTVVAVFIGVMLMRGRVSGASSMKRKKIMCVVMSVLFMALLPWIVPMFPVSHGRSGKGIPTNPMQASATAYELRGNNSRGGLTHTLFFPRPFSARCL